MRITNSMMIADMLWNSNKNLNALNVYQNQLSTGLAISRPSDDPVGITKVLNYKSDISAAEQYTENITTSRGWLEMSESAMDDVKEVLQRVRELTVQAANGSNTEADTQKMMTEVQQLRKEIISLGNSTIAGKYIFSGLETDEPLFNEDGTYNIDLTTERLDEQNVVSYEVYVGVVMDVGTYPTDLFGVTEDTSFFSSLLTRGSVETTEATRSKMTVDVDLSNDFEAVGEAIGIDVGGTTYNVDMTALAQDVRDPLTTTDVVSALKNADDGSGNKLSDVANVYYDQNGQLVIEAKAYGSATTITDASTSAGFTMDTNVTGVDEGSAVYTSDAVLTDAAVADYTDKSSLVITVNGVQEKLEIDFSTLSTVSDLVTEIQSQLDSKFPPAGTVTAAGADGTNLTLTIVGNTDGTTNTLDVDYITTNKSKMIDDLDKLIAAMNIGDSDTLSDMLGDIDDDLELVLTAMGEVGGKSNRIDFIDSRVEDNILSFTDLLSAVQDVDMAEAIMYYKNLENVYKASLSVGAQVIQPSLVDFLS